MRPDGLQVNVVLLLCKRKFGSHTRGYRLTTGKKS